MIEQFMLCANAAVANYFLERRLPCVFRVHESPDPLRLADLGAFARSLGIKWRSVPGDSGRSAINSLLADAEKRKLADTVSYPVLRAMAKVVVKLGTSPKNDGYTIKSLTMNNVNTKGYCFA